MAQDAANTVLLAGDEAGLFLQATTYHVWPPTRQTPIVRADPGRAKTNFYGALTLQTGQHLEMSVEANPDVPILLFWDRAPWHRGQSIDKVV